MARTTADQWAEARAKREAGMSLSDVAKWLGVDRALVSRKATKEQWGDGSDLEEVIHRKVTEKVTGIVTPHDPKRLAEAIDAEAQKRVSVIERHKAEWDDHKGLMSSAVAERDFETAKLAKITAETIAIRQAGERKAWGLDTAEKVKHVGPGGGPIQHQEIPADPVEAARAYQQLMGK